MVFRREKGVDTFNRQFSALKHQLSGASPGEGEDAEGDAMVPTQSQAPDGERAAYGASSLARQDRADPDSDTRYGLDTHYDAPASDPYGVSAPAPVAGSGSGSGTGLARTGDAVAMSSDPILDQRTSVIAQDTVWKGELETGGSLHVIGTVQGSLTAGETIFIAEEANVDATLTARHVVVAGTVRGTILCSERFEAVSTGRVLADILAPAIVVHEGATIRGQFQMERAIEKSDQNPKTAPAYRRAGRGR
ncbi:MAG: polymer-forming cytoskeletal protein [Thermomicrobiales bacterium]